MLIDAAHPEETRVVVVRGNRIEEFDYESATRKQLRGNIYLAKVTRVEPSLQAAFVDYGGNRHGFLAFNEIHPDYYQIPYADRQALLREEAAEQAQTAQEEDDDHTSDVAGASEDGADKAVASAADDASEEDASDNGSDDNGDDDDNGLINGEETNGENSVESVGSEDALEEVPQRTTHRKRRTYKIQEVIKRRQVILVQVVKEERGTKGAALTTYLSLAGRYCVLMPNTARGGGISRKITDAADRKRLKEVANSIEIPEGMGLIIRTAGANRTKTEIKRDFDYLVRLWESVRDLTLKSKAPCLVYEEGSLVKRSIRDLYTKDIEEILVEGEEAYKEAKDFMRMLMPSHARFVKLYKDPQPLFMRYQIENQLDQLFSPQVTLPSGGYIVINQTEALVAVDVNSGKATREYNIEDTALKTNLEAADEIARQMRLRDLAGLIVIDFIDMEERRNNRAVERRLKERMKSDRARIQIGRISHFGILEMSRQRMRQGVLEASTKPCPYCEGRGFVRSVQSSALQVLRSIEEYLQRNKANQITVRTEPAVALYVLNQKRDHLLAIQRSHKVRIFVDADEDIHGAECKIESIAAPEYVATDEDDVISIDSAYEQDVRAEAVEVEAAGEGDEAEDRNGNGKRKRRRRRRGRRNGRVEAAATESQVSTQEDGDGTASGDDGAATDTSGDEPAAGEEAAVKEASVEEAPVDAAVSVEAATEEVAEDVPAPASAEAAEDVMPKPGRRPRSRARKGNGADPVKEGTPKGDASVARDADRDEPEASPALTAADQEGLRDGRRRSRRSSRAKPDVAAEPEKGDESSSNAVAATNGSGEEAAVEQAEPTDEGKDAGEASSEAAQPQPQPTRVPPGYSASIGDRPTEPRRGWWQRR